MEVDNSKFTKEERIFLLVSYPNRLVPSRRNVSKIYNKFLRAGSVVDA
jgi:hypothetical protein